MSLILYYQPSFNRSLKILGHKQREITGRILEALEAYYNSNCDLSEAKRISSRFFYKQLRKPYYEAGIEKSIRVVIRRDKEKCIVMIAGNHSQIKQFLARI